jgi:putative hydrolase of the HAD superfamily
MIIRAMRIRTLCLDAGGVLLHPDWVRIGEVLRGHGIDTDPVGLEKAESHARRFLDDAGRIRETTDAARAALYFEITLRNVGIAVEPERFAAAWADLARVHARSNLWSRVDPEVPAVLAGLRAAGLRLAVVSNANGTVATHFEELGLARLVDVIVDSGAEGVEKPDPAIFRLALERVGGRADEAAHVGDLYHVDVVGARAAGLDAWLFDPTGLYADADCPRVASLGELARRLTA